MKVYKFRSLSNELEYCRAKSILETGEFHCAKFSELNDPMEGSFHASNSDEVNQIFSEKMRYKLCSFSGKKAFENPAMWGYYANGFRGVAIEVEIERTKVKKMIYKKSINFLEELPYLNKTEIILTSKLMPWRHEEEYRFLIESNNDKHKIGEITAVYFGNPYGNAVNKNPIYRNTGELNDYERFNEALAMSAKINDIPYYSVKIENSKVIKV